MVNSFPSTCIMKLFEHTKVRSSLIDLTRQTWSKEPISFSPAILSWKSGMGKFSGSFLSIHYFHWASFLCMLSGKSLKKARGSLPKWCLLKARIFSQALSVMKLNGLYFSDLMSREAPPFKNTFTSALVIFSAVTKSLKHIIRI